MKVPALAAITALTAMGGAIDQLPAARKKEPKVFTAFDQERLDKAQAKRERKAKKLVERGHL